MQKIGNRKHAKIKDVSEQKSNSMQSSIKVSIIIFALCAINAFAQFSAKHGIMAVSQDLSPYIGKEYVYTDVIKQFKQPFFPPFPYSEGRIRDGKYKASETALEKYVQGLRNYFGKKFTVVRFEVGEFNLPGAVMACENGDTLFFQGNIIDMQFVDAEYYDAQIKNTGAKLTITNFPEQRSKPKQQYYDIFFGCKSTKDGSFTHEMPNNSEWTVKSVVFDTTYVIAGPADATPRTMYTDSENYRTYDRFKYTITNKQYGTYECFPNNHLSDFEIKK